ncbi:MAG: hypothetical protein NC821_04125, partial [Candidatus Omnitrophica bacterium]|nr:hypothetical protein [Candidatus Omnitrophota bacterium]
EIKMILTQVKNGYENIAYFFPFVSTPEELDALFTILEEEEKNMGVYLKKIGMMTELPSNIILADEFAQVMAKHVQKVRAEAGIERKIFFSFGTNDLTQTTFRYDRDDPAWKERFQEGSKEIIASIKHVVAVAKKNGIETGLCGQAIVKLLQTDPETAEEIIALLGSTGGSTGVDYLGYADAVARAASADLHNGSISQQEASKAHVLAEGVSSIKKGAASRPLYKFDDSYIGDFVLVDRVFDLNDPATRAKLVRIGTFIGTSQMIEQFKTNIQRAIQAAQGLSDEKTKVALLTTLRSIERIPTFVVSPTVYSSLNREKAGTVITIDFERDKIYSGKIPIVIKVDLTDPLEIPSVRGKPAEMKVSLISASEIYKSDALSKLHPLNFVYYAKGKHIDPTARRRIDGMLRDRKLTSAERLYITIIKEQILKRQQVTPGGVKLVYATADMNSWDLAQLDYPLETPAQNEVVNPPIAYGGLARLVDDKLEYKTLLKWEFQAIKELKDEGFDIALQFNDVREALYLEKAIGLLQNIGLDSIEIGMDITTPTNYLFPKDFMKYLSFINIDETKLGIAFLAADILGNPRVAEAYPPEVIRKNIQKVINILTLAAEQNRIKLALNIGSKP